jgi:hypothetical protein
MIVCNNWEDVEGNTRVLWYFPNSYLQLTELNDDNLSENCPFAGWDSNEGPPEYEPPRSLLLDISQYSTLLASEGRSFAYNIYSCIIRSSAYQLEIFFQVVRASPVKIWCCTCNS